MGSEGIAPPFLASALDGGEWSALLAGRFTPGKKAPLYLLDRRLGGSQNRSGRRRKISYPYLESNPGRPALSPSLYRLSIKINWPAMSCLPFFQNRLRSGKFTHP
jgi:hypothetical protein